MWMSFVRKERRFELGKKIFVFFVAYFGFGGKSMLNYFNLIVIQIEKYVVFLFLFHSYVQFKLKFK